MASSSGTGGARKRDNVALRRELRDYVTAWMKNQRGCDTQHLADLVMAAPAFQTLDANEWWNVALMLACEVRGAR